MKIFKLLLKIAIFIALTVFTQVGGIIYLLTICINKSIFGKISITINKNIFRLLTFLILYFIATFAIIPTIAKSFGRIKLPLSESGHLQPLNIMTSILNRNYVTLDLYQAITNIAEEMNKRNPGTIVNYLDANFPFIDKFPLFPHLSHNDGRKLDLSFCYIVSNTGLPTDKAPSVIGYGICEEPKPGEENKPQFCHEKGYWHYSFLKSIVPQRSKLNYTFDEKRTRNLIEIILAQKSLEKIFIEPHLVKRLALSSDKIRFQGCKAVRHDDHIHIQCY